MPGFTADSSLYRTGGYYHGTASLEVKNGVILPQQCSLSCLGECLSACTEVGGGPQCRADCRRGCGCGGPRCTCTRTRCCGGNCSTSPVSC